MFSKNLVDERFLTRARSNEWEDGSHCLACNTDSARVSSNLENP